MSSEIQNLIDAHQLKADVAFNATDLDSMWASQAALYVRYGVLAARAEHQSNAFKNRLAIVEAQLGKEARDELPKSGIKVTEGTVTEFVQSHASRLKAFNDYNRAILIFNLSKTALEALRQRRDMIVQASKHHLEQAVMRGDFKGGAVPAARAEERKTMLDSLERQSKREQTMEESEG